MFDVIVACTNNFGIGRAGEMAWHCSEELRLFRAKTKGSVLIVGRKTVETLPELPGRTIICVSRRNLSLKSALELASTQYPHKKVFIAGGGQIYQECFRSMPEKINRVHISFLHENVPCDTFLSINMSEWVIEESSEHKEFTHYVLKRESEYGERQYLQLLNEVRHTGTIKSGRNGNTLSKFVKHLTFDLRNGFPLITTKKMFTRGVIEELLFFLRGETNSKLLEDIGVNIWKWNTSREFLNKIGMPKRKEGMMGPMYGAQWRHFNGSYDEDTGKMSEGVDQLEYVVNTIRTEPHSRRILLTDYNPSQVKQGVLFPCHSIIDQFYVSDGCLDMFCLIRSSDLFLGLPFNIAMAAIFLTLIAKLTKYTPRFLYLTLADAHIYEEHISAVETQIVRQPYAFPTLEINKELHTIKDLETLTIDDFTIRNYQHHPVIKAKMIA